MLLFDAPEKRKATKRKNPVDKTYPISFVFLGIKKDRISGLFLYVKHK